MKPTDHFVIDGSLVQRGVIDLVAAVARLENGPRSRRIAPGPTCLQARRSENLDCPEMAPPSALDSWGGRLRERRNDGNRGVVHLGELRADRLNSDDAQDRDDAEEQRVLDQVLADLFAPETGDQLLHSLSPNLSF